METLPTPQTQTTDAASKHGFSFSGEYRLRDPHVCRRLWPYVGGCQDLASTSAYFCILSCIRSVISNIQTS